MTCFGVSSRCHLWQLCAYINVVYGLIWQSIVKFLIDFQKLNSTPFFNYFNILIFDIDYQIDKGGILIH